MTLSFAFRIMALVVFIIAVLLAFCIRDVTLTTIVGLVSAGLAAWVGSTLIL